MKKTNKKGFTLAELLIVIAIIAILIAIAIPAFGGALDNAKIQTDHANMRAAYAIAQVANLQGTVPVKNSTTHVVEDTPITVSTTYYFMADGSVAASASGGGAPDGAYLTKIAADFDDDCDSSAVCQTTGSHAKGKAIIIKVDSNGNATAKIAG